MKNHLKIYLKAVLGHLFLDSRRFGEWPKKRDFLMPLRWLKNPENRCRNGSKDAFPPQPDGQGMVEGIVLGARVRGAATRARCHKPKA